MNITRSPYAVISFFLFLALIPLETQAANDQFGEFEQLGGIVGTDSIDEFAKNDQALTATVGKLATYITAAIIGVSLIMIVGAGYVYMTAGGDAARVGTAKSILFTSLLAIALAVAGFLILNTISTQFAEDAKDPQFDF